MLGADVVIGAVLVAGASAPKLVTRDMLPRMKRGAVLVDVSIDQGGCFETSRPTTHDQPDLRGRRHHSLLRGEHAWRGSGHLGAGAQQRHPALRDQARHKGLAAFDDDPHLAAGLNVRDGRIMHKAVAASLGFDGAPAGNVRLVAAE